MIALDNGNEDDSRLDQWQNNQKVKLIVCGKATVERVLRDRGDTVLVPYDPEKAKHPIETNEKELTLLGN